MSLKQKIQDALIVVMKSKDVDSLSTLRMLVSAIKNEEIDSDGPLTDEQILTIIARQVKQLKDAVLDFESGGRNDLAEKNKKEIELLEQYLPKQVGDDEIKKIVSEVILEVGAQTFSDLGKVMGLAMKKLQGVADGNRVRTIAQSLLTD